MPKFSRRLKRLSTGRFTPPPMNPGVIWATRANGRVPVCPLFQQIPLANQSPMKLIVTAQYWIGVATCQNHHVLGLLINLPFQRKEGKVIRVFWSQFGRIPFTHERFIKPILGLSSCSDTRLFRRDGETTWSNSFPGGLGRLPRAGARPLPEAKLEITTGYRFSQRNMRPRCN